MNSRLNTQNKQGERKKLPYVCDICDERVEKAEKKDGEGIGSIWVCEDCFMTYY